MVVKLDRLVVFLVDKELMALAVWMGILGVLPGRLVDKKELMVSAAWMGILGVLPGHLVGNEVFVGLGAWPEHRVLVVVMVGNEVLLEH